MAKSISKKFFLTVACIAALLVGTTSMCFAAEETTPAHITVPVTAIDFSVTEKINMTGAENSADLTVDSLVVTNNSAMGVLNIDSIAATGANGWTIVADSTDFTTLAKDAQKVSLMADGTNDMISTYTGAGTIDPGQSDTTTFTGKTGMVTIAVTDTQVADIITTVSYK